MPELLHCLSGHDFGFMRIVSDLWGVNIVGKDAPALARSLASSLLNMTELQDMVSGLSDEAQQALNQLKQNGGTLPWSVFSHRFGPLRSMGPARREREKPYLFPVSTTERLWYRALIGRDFVRQDDQLVEVAYIPSDFLEWLPEQSEEMDELAEVALIKDNLIEVEEESPSNDQILDNCCTLLSALRLDDSTFWKEALGKSDIYWQNLHQLLKCLSLFEQSDKSPAPEAKPFLELPRSAALTWIQEEWAQSRSYNELRYVPEFTCEGTWQNDPLLPRRLVLNQIRRLKGEGWIRVEDLIAGIHSKYPDFLRKDGEYSAWIIKSNHPNKGLLRGFESWNDVEGAYIRFLIKGPLTWLGLVDYGHEKSDPRSECFRKTRRTVSPGISADGSALPSEDAPVAISSSGLLTMTNLTPRIARYQISRFCEWVAIHPKRYQYQLTPTSLRIANSHGLTIKHLLSLLRKFSHSNPPPSLVKAIQRWQTNGREAWMGSLCILRLSSPELLSELRGSTAAKYLDEALSPVAVVIKPEGIEFIRTTLARMGYLADIGDI